MAERLDTLARQMVESREKRDTTATAAKSAEKAYKEIERDFWEHMSDLGLTTAKLDLPGIGSVQFQRRETIRGIVTDHAAAVKALVDGGLDDALLGDRKIQQRALNEMMRSWLDSGQPIPEGLDFNPSRYVSITRK